MIAALPQQTERRRLNWDFKVRHIEHLNSPEHAAYVAKREAAKDLKTDREAAKARHDEEIRRKLPRQNYDDDT